tara:strand:+ start:1044 stop:1184 length:141 start_codon:yes stop_codon:yes gene_type:complete
MNALETAKSETIDWIVNELSKQADRDGDKALVDACGKIIQAIKDVK